MDDTPSLNEAITGEIRAELARAKISQNDFAARCGWTASSLSRRMSGDVPWSTDELEIIGKVLDLPLDQLMNPVRR